MAKDRSLLIAIVGILVLACTIGAIYSNSIPAEQLEGNMAGAALRWHIQGNMKCTNYKFMTWDYCVDLCGSRYDTTGTWGSYYAWGEECCCISTVGQ